MELRSPVCDFIVFYTFQLTLVLFNYCIIDSDNNVNERFFRRNRAKIAEK